MSILHKQQAIFMNSVENNDLSLIKTDLNNLNDLDEKKKNSFFDQLICEAKTAPITDFNLSSSFNDYIKPSINNQNTSKKDILNDFSNDKNIIKTNIQANKMKESTNLTKEKVEHLIVACEKMKNKLKNKINNKNKSISFKKKLRSFNSNKSFMKVKTVKKIYIDDNIYKFDDGLIETKNLNSKDNLTSKFVLKKKDEKLIFEDIDDKSNINDSKKNDFLVSSSINSPIINLFTFNKEKNTTVIVLIQQNQITIWLKEEKWFSKLFKLEEDQQVFRCKKIDKNNFSVVLLLVNFQNLISLKYCYINKITKDVQLVHGETFEISKIDLNLIHFCFINPNFIALSIPRINEDIIDILLYDQINFELEFNKSKKIIYMLNNKNNKFSCINNCFLSSEDLDNTFLGIFNQNLIMCNVTDHNKTSKMISLKKFANLSYEYFDILYDKGIFYIFVGNYHLNYVRIIALNTERCLAEKLIKYNIEKSLNVENVSSSLSNTSNELFDKKENEDNSLPNQAVQFFKRDGDHLLIVKKDNTVILFNLFTDKIVYQTKIDDINNTALASLNDETTILAVVNNQNIVNLFNF